MLKGIETMLISSLLMINKKNVYEAARKAADGVDKGLDERYGQRKSEAIQADMCSVVGTFAKTFQATLQKDWTPEMKKKFANKGVVIVETEEKKEPVPKEKSEKKEGKGGSKKKGAGSKK